MSDKQAATDTDDVYDPATGELLHDERGAPINEQYIERVAREAERGYDLSKATRVGRPSLTGDSGHSPRVSFRLSDETRARAERVAQAEGKSVSQLAREALERYLAS